MVWVFGSVFLVFVAILAVWLYRNSARNRAKFESFPRGKRVLFGTLGSLASFGSALGALWCATAVTDWSHPPVVAMVGTMAFMMLFVVLQVGAMLSFVSIIADKETGEPSERS